jgi:DMSO/TMAO reductase YedYZ molybdopterin-dependent catalytic subunit
MSSPQVSSEMQAGPIIREREPVNFEYPFDHLSDGMGTQDRLTPNDLFYIRSHFKAPKLEAATHILAIDGCVQTPLTLSLAELKKMPAETCTATLECAGNGRVFLTPAEEGAQWQLGAVATAEWTGVPLAALLERVGIRENAVELIFEGAGSGKAKEKPIPPGEIVYARSIPITKAHDVLLAYQMNGEDLPVDHGFPLRAIVPGYFGMASVKWLTSIRAVSAPFQGYWQTSDYAFWDWQDGLPARKPLWAMKVKSSIARPRTREVVPTGQTFTVFGAAWTGEKEILSVEVSTDDGTTWSAAKIIDEPIYGVWRRWKYDWTVPLEPGWHILKSRATDSAGSVQPVEHDKNYGSYVIHHSVGIEVVTK